MNLIIKTVAFCLCLTAVTSAPTNFENRDGFDLITALLPVYGGVQLKSMATQRTINMIKGFFERNPKHYNNIRAGLANEKVFLPELTKFNWNFMVAADFTFFISLIGTSTIKDAMNPVWQAALVAKFTPEVRKKAETIFKKSGIVFGNYVLETLLPALKKIVEPVISDFIPTAIQIFLLGGKREVDFKQTLFPPLSAAVIQKIKDFLASGTAEAKSILKFFKDNNINVNVVYGHLAAGTMQNFLTPQLITAGQNFLIANPTILPLVLTFISQNNIGKREVDLKQTVFPPLSAAVIQKIKEFFASGSVIATDILTFLAQNNLNTNTLIQHLANGTIQSIFTSQLLMNFHQFTVTHPSYLPFIMNLINGGSL